ncbi:MAG TPA: AI-2E family transporter [Solirubrobacteraceae bacterium]|jgi:predicted PurR-regulated permease PerM|nr:AI-2E family transporter [Solirubrobacteraceae bacterium]
MHETDVQPDPPTGESGSTQTDEHPPAPAEQPDSEPSSESPPTVSQRLVEPMLVPRWVQLVLLPLAILGVWELARAIGTLLVVIMAASVIALILNPLAKHLQRVVPRGIAIILSYVAILLIFGAIGALLSAPVSDQLSHFSNNFPHFVKRVNHDLVSIQNFLQHHGVKVHFAQQGHSALQTIQKKVLKSSGSILSVSRDVLGKLVTLSVDLILTFVLSVYMLVYARHIGDLARRWMPPGDGTPGDDYPLLIQHAVSGYVRGQLLFSLVMGGSAAILMELMGLIGLFPDGSHYAVFFGLFYGLMELIPYIGPIIGPIPPIVVALATHPVSAIWVLIVFIALQQLEGHLVAPQVFRISLRINPILVILALLIGYQIYGIPGALLALPIATIVRETIVYLRKHLVLESWSTGQPRL